ncbi:hypothetical protein BGX27_010995 [Mortierella sp. AM989]|nr:hypothetical protein BGX27_010995 [Mortierella sp. AM989]
MAKFTSLTLAAIVAALAVASGASAAVGTNVHKHGRLDRLRLKADTLASHNSARAEYSAEPLTWDRRLYRSSLRYARQCIFRDSGIKKYGENTGSVFKLNDTVSDAVTGWMRMMDLYEWERPEMPQGAQPFTQIVWKSTKSVGCAEVICPAEASNGLYDRPMKRIVCHYSPPGNIIGQYSANVGRHISREGEPIIGL